MEKHQSHSSTKKRASINNASYDTSSLRIDKGSEAPRKISRQDISKCISIWASLYFLEDEEADSPELCMPSRPWIGRSPNSLKRFE